MSKRQRDTWIFVISAVVLLLLVINALLRNVAVMDQRHHELQEETWQPSRS